MTESTHQQPGLAQLAYAPPARRESKVWAGFAVAFVGLILMFFGGCFFVGILTQLTPNMGFGAPTAVAPAWQMRDYVFHVILYLLGFAFIGSGALLVIQGVKGLLRILMDAHH